MYSVPSLPYMMDTMIFQIWGNFDKVFCCIKENYANLIILYKYQSKTLAPYTIMQI